MKTKKILFRFSALFLLIFLISCKKQELKIPENTLPPAIELTAVPTAKTADWYEVTLAGQITDTVGIKSIHLKCNAFKLDQVIKLTLDPKITTYTLNRIIKAPLNVREQENTIQVTVENAYGLTTSIDLKVSDIEAPSFKAPLKDFIVEIANNQAKLSLSFTAIDNKDLKSVVVKIPDLNINDSTAVSGTSFNFAKDLTLPTKKGSFPVSVTLEDASGLKTTQQVSIRISEVVPYTGEIDLYITNAKSQADLARYISGNPGIITKKGNYLYEAKYYSPAAGTEIYFLGQKTFAGYLFGQDPLGDPGTLSFDAATSKPIVLPAKGYYTISLDTKTETYTVAVDTPPTSELWALPNNPLAMTGAYFNDFPAASRPRSAVECVQDASNPYLYKTRVRMHQLISFSLTPKDVPNDKFLSPFWRYDSTLNGKLIQGSTGKNVSYVLANPTTVYWIIITFDLHLQTCVIENDGPAQ